MPDRRDLSASLRAMQDVPPPEAWNNPKKWLRFERGVAVGMNPDVERMNLPVDDRGLILGHEAVRMVRGIFKADYIWSYSPHDRLTSPDVHHWYGTENDYDPMYFDGYTLPKRFRNLPPNLLYSQRMFHNTLHKTTTLLQIPEIKVMEGFDSNFRLAATAFTRVLESAKKAHQFKARFSSRRQTIKEAQGILPNGATDEIGEAILRSEFRKNFTAYSDALAQAGVTLDYLYRIDEEFIPYVEALSLCRRGLADTLKHSGKLLSFKNSLSVVSELMQPAA